ncbi:MAG: YHS domain-containing (seleno)protein [Leptolyngbyaceae bacterium]|nr:YHS domain-containing (seleno)protein [Leptolyngbyaceae bacterium]
MHIQYLSKVALALFMSLALVEAGCATARHSTSSNNSQEQATDVAVTTKTYTDVTSSTSARTDTSITIATSQPKTPNIRYFGDSKGAIRGTDPVAYFTQGRPIAGSSKFTYTWNNATWRFASAENRQLFAANPKRYAPQYGGFCAWAVSQGYTASIDPNAWKIVDGKLYLNYNKGVQRQWERDIPGNIRKANANWPGVLK